MSKSKEELNEIKEEVETVSEKMRTLTEEKLAQVVGGLGLGSEEMAGVEMKPLDICNQVLRDQCQNLACPYFEVQGGGISFFCHKYNMHVISSGKGRD